MRPCLFLVAVCAAACTQPRARRAGAEPRDQRRCAIISTDDDIPSGSATAGALYVKDAALGKKLLTADVVAVARGFQAGGVSCVKVLDSHDGAIDPAPLRRIGVPVLTPSNTRWTWPFLGPTPRRIILGALVGKHSPAGARGFRPHTINDNIRSLRINGEAVGEVTHMILGFGAFGVPVVLVSGDMNATAEAAALVPDVEGVTVRWLGSDGKPRFMPAGQAARKLRAAARRAALEKRRRPYVTSQPLRVELETYSGKLMAARYPSLVPGYRAALARRPAIRRALAGFDFRPVVAGRRLSWAPGSQLAAYVTIAFAAGHLRVSNWDKVTAGYQAFTAARYEAALRAYKEALEQNPADVATRCRLAAVHQKLGQLEQARRLFEHGVAHIDEISGAPMKTWCALGLAEVTQALGDLDAARAAARRVLALPEFRDRHRKAREILRRIEGKSRKTRRP